MVVRALNVAEKPSVAKAVAEILSGGHLMELEFEERYRKWTSCDPADLYHAPVRKSVPSDKLPLQRTLQEEARRCSWLVLWLDCDREGENIAYEVVEICRSSNPRLNIWRARFSALIQRDIHHAVQNLTRPNPLFADAVDARQEIDLRIGASFTRFQTMLLGDSFVFPFAENDKRLVLSYGPCQFPTLGFVVERYWEIQAHQPEDFWTINCQYTSDEGNAKFNWKRGRLFDHLAAVLIYEMCVEEPLATVYEVTGKESRKNPPHPLNTVELQKRASRYFRMSSEQTMKVAEELYQAGFISYPRTETDSFPENFDLQVIVRQQVEHSVWGSYAERLLDSSTNLWRQPSNGGHDDKAHPPIHPTKYSGGESNWSNDHSRVYELVTRHFLACVSQPAIGYGTTALIDIAGEIFSASGLMITAKNYLEVYRFESWGGSTIPNFEVGQQFIPTSLTLDMGTTMPPPLLSEADLITLMDQAGIGTDATMHDHIKKLLDRCYATKDVNTRFSPTKLGEALVMAYDMMGYELWKPYLRAMMERDMKAVSDGTKTKAEVLESSLRQMKECFLDAKSQKMKMFEAMQLFFERTNRPLSDQQVGGEVVRNCSACNDADMVLRKRPDGKFMVGCLNYPHCRNATWLPNALLEASVSDEICNRCGPGAVYRIKFKFKQGEIPPQYATEHTGCVGGCDTILKELIEICGTGTRNISGSRPGGNRGTSNAQMNSRSAAQRGPPSHDQHPTSIRLDPVLCHCQQVCSLLTAQTENNRGRRFYRCAANNCDFFLWETSAPSHANLSDASRITNRTSQGQHHRRSQTRFGQTNQGQPGRTASGREHGGRSTTANSGAFVRATGEVISHNSCFICGDTSHWANNCPNRNTS
ncbi:hypothetical protein KP509_15G013100 [Ceratopteris richardii]|uniref:DNA topoisomerase n=1 Tax=Ceratopteris richardii TaxID=49495 RepID=A0A8T2T4U4_CERRI|nr:hypothetical protein KP509_15G013100 [Ceratopteris richardii]